MSRRELRDRLYEWHLRVAESLIAMSPLEIAVLDAWRESHPGKSDADWPELLAIVGPRPMSAPVVKLTERSA
jgi:hypothetical protein